MSGADSTCRIEVILSSVCGAQDCHASIAALADDHGQATLKNVDEAGIGCVVNVNSVTTPKLPPAPPFSAHSRSGSEPASTERSVPSAVTIRTALRLSIVSPRCRAASPNPPPSVTPAIPTDGHEPPGTVTPD